MVASPCINVCQMDQASGLCQGCFRTLDEIALWSRLDDRQRRDVLAAVACRREHRPTNRQSPGDCTRND
jgi:predicted Fe-S protein YdhL (DUF1289 family)